MFLTEMQWTESGNFCDRTLESCDLESSVKNWVITQSILRTSNVSYPLKVTVQLEADTTQSCVDSQTCSSGTAGVYYYPSNGEAAGNERTNTDNYVSIVTTSLTITPKTHSFSFGLDANYDRFYIAVVDQGYCVTLRKLHVFYNTCIAETTSKNVVYPSIPVGDTTVPATASCSGSFAPSPGSSLDITCNPDGTFSGSPDCSICQGGHFMSSGQCLRKTWLTKLLKAKRIV